MSVLDEKGVSNKKDHREISDQLDKEYFKDHPRQRAAVHCVYHTGMSVAKYFHGNKEGGDAEIMRAAVQFLGTRSPSPK